MLLPPWGIEDISAGLADLLYFIAHFVQFPHSVNMLELLDPRMTDTL